MQLIDVVIMAIAVEFLGDPLQRRQTSVAIRKAQRVELIDQVVFPTWPLPGGIPPNIGAASRHQGTGSQVGVCHLSRCRILNALRNSILPGQFKTIAVASPRCSGKPCREALKPPEFSIRRGREVDGVACIISEIPKEPDTADIRPCVQDGKPLSAFLIKAGRPMPDRSRIIIEPAKSAARD